MCSSSFQPSFLTVFPFYIQKNSGTAFLIHPEMGVTKRLTLDVRELTRALAEIILDIKPGGLNNHHVLVMQPVSHVHVTTSEFPIPLSEYQDGTKIICLPTTDTSNNSLFRMPSDRASGAGAFSPPENLDIKPVLTPRSMDSTMGASADCPITLDEDSDSETGTPAINAPVSKVTVDVPPATASVASDTPVSKDTVDDPPATASVATATPTPDFSNKTYENDTFDEASAAALQDMMTLLKETKNATVLSEFFCAKQRFLVAERPSLPEPFAIYAIASSDIQNPSVRSKAVDTIAYSKSITRVKSDGALVKDHRISVRTSTCVGARECPNLDCSHFLTFAKPNTTNFKTSMSKESLHIVVCLSCKTPVPPKVSLYISHSLNMPPYAMFWLLYYL